MADGPTDCHEKCDHFTRRQHASRAPRHQGSCAKQVQRLDGPRLQVGTWQMTLIGGGSLFNADPMLSQPTSLFIGWGVGAPPKVMIPTKPQDPYSLTGVDYYGVNISGNSDRFSGASLHPLLLRLTHPGSRCTSFYLVVWIDALAGSFYPFPQQALKSSNIQSS